MTKSYTAQKLRLGALLLAMLLLLSALFGCGSADEPLFESTPEAENTSGTAGENVNGLGITFFVDTMDTTVNSEEDATFTVTAAGGKAPYTYKWWTDSDHSVASENISGDDTDTLTLKSIAPEQNGSLVWCVVTDAEGNSATSNKATLTVLDIFRVKVQPADIEMVAGKFAPFWVTVTGGIAPYVFFLQMSENGEDGWYDVEYGDTCQSDPCCGVMNSPKASCYYRFRIVDDYENGEEIFSEKAFVTVKPAQ